MAFQNQEIQTTSASHEDVSQNLLRGIWTRPGAETTTGATDVATADGAISDTLIDSTPLGGLARAQEEADSTPPAGVARPQQVAGLTDEQSLAMGLATPLFPTASGDSTEVASAAEIAENAVEVARARSPLRTVEDLANTVRDSIGKTELGNRVPRNAREFAGESVPEHLQCASTTSDWLIQLGMMSPRDYKIRVKDMNTWLERNGFQRVNLSGNLDPSKFPDGPIGFISGIGNSSGGNHMAFVEKRNGELRIIHNKEGRVVDEPITEKFYDGNGKPRYREMSLFIFPKR